MEGFAFHLITQNRVLRRGGIERLFFDLDLPDISWFVNRIYKKNFIEIIQYTILTYMHRIDAEKRNVRNDYRIY